MKLKQQKSSPVNIGLDHIIYLSSLASVLSVFGYSRTTYLAIDPKQSVGFDSHSNSVFQIHE